jgi:hypothetical protein
MHAFISSHARITLGLTVAFALLTLVTQIDTGRCLKTDNTPGGILALELAWDQLTAENIRKEWLNPCTVIQPSCADKPEINSMIDAAIKNIRWDFVFILAYVALLYVLVVLHETRFSKIGARPYTAVICLLCVLAGILDVFENILMLRFLQGDSASIWQVTVLASLKFLTLALVTTYIIWRGAYPKRFSAFAITMVHILWENRVSVIGLLVIYFALWKSDQGQDLLINLNASHWGPITFYIILSILATFYWYWPKYFAPEKWEDQGETPSVSFKSLIRGDWNSRCESIDASYIPRLLGLLTFIVPACGILQALDIFQIPYALDFLDPLLWLTISIVIFMVLMENHVLEKFFDSAPRAYYSIIVFFFLVVLGLGLLNRYSANQLGLLTTGLYAIACMFIMITSVRNNPDFYNISPLRWAKHVKANTWMMIFAMLASFIFFAFNCYPYITANGPYRFITLPVVLTGIVFYSFVFFLLMIWGKKKKINFSGFLIVISIITAVSFDNKYHDVKIIDREMKATLPSLTSYIKNWVLSRRDEILHHQGSYPVFVVNSYGGGIRAAAWTTLSISFLDSITNNRFQNHVLAYSGASGGTIGSSVLCAVLRNDMMDSLTMRQVKQFYQNDFLTPVLIGLLGRDVWFSTLGISWYNDRSRLQDKIWERHTQENAGPYFQREFSSLWYPDGHPDFKIPLLFSNTYHVEKGLKAILAPVSLDTAQFESAVIVNNLLNQKSVLYSTGSFLSARFPYISPAGKIDDDHHFLDGGLKENSGAETSEEIYRVYKQLSDVIKLDTALASDTLRRLFSKIEVHFLSLNNSVAHTDDPGPSRNLIELAAPFEALYNNWVGNTSKADSILRLRHRATYFELRPTANCVDGFKPVLPLGWQISDRALTGMMKSLSDSCGINLRQMHCIKQIVTSGTTKQQCDGLNSPCNPSVNNQSVK